MSDDNRLCRRINPFYDYGIMAFEKVSQEVNFAFRFFRMTDKDLSFIKNCTIKNENVDYDIFRKAYYNIATSTNSQAFILLRLMEPVAIAEVCEATAHEVGDEYEALENDYFIDVFMTGELKAAEHIFLLRFFTGYCCDFAEVNRIIMRSGAVTRRILEETGFKALKIMKNPELFYFNCPGKSNGRETK